VVQFTTTILQFAEQGEKTGWTYIKIPTDIAQKLKPGNKKTFRVKGSLDDFSIKKIALMPAGDGDFIMPLNASIRKGIHKKKGAMVKVKLEVDNQAPKLSKQLLECLADEPKALNFFNEFSPSHKLYFSNWIESAKTEPTKTKRIAQTVSALLRKFDFGQMLRSLKQSKDDLS
jgi:hypothetical protein